MSFLSKKCFTKSTTQNVLFMLFSRSKRTFNFKSLINLSADFEALPLGATFPKILVQSKESCHRLVEQKYISYFLKESYGFFQKQSSW